MDPEAVLRKTAKGREEIEKRTFRLDAKRRTLLILVDGRSSGSELAAKMAHIAEPLALLQSLLSEGFLEPAEPTGASLEELKRKASKEIERLLGPDGEAIALELERAATRQEFLAEAQKAREVMHAHLGPRKADEFWKSLGI